MFYQTGSSWDIGAVDDMAVQLVSFTEAEVESFTTIGAIMDVLDIPASDVPTSYRATVHRMLGTTDATKPRLIGSIPEAAYQATVDNIRFANAPGEGADPVFDVAPTL